MRVLIACEYSGRTREAFRARGHEVYSCDLLPSEDNSPFHLVDDVFNVITTAQKLGRPFDLMVAHPPCTYLANSGVRWLYREEPCYASHESTSYDDVRTVREEARWRDMEAGANFFAKLLLAPIPKIAVENPVMHRHARAAIEHILHGAMDGMNTHFVQPWWFGDKAFKATGFTLKGLPRLTKPSTALTPPARGTQEHKAWSVIHNASPGPNRWKERSRTFPGIAKAMAEAWG
jgi:hypothetical protein